jgi:hypothetical protein
MGVKKTILILSLIIIFTSMDAWAIWNPDTTSTSSIYGVKFNLNFENNSDPCTREAGPLHLWGKRSPAPEVNSTNTNIFELNSYSKAGLGTDANFMPSHDGGNKANDDKNDVSVHIPYNSSGEYGNLIFDLGNDSGTSQPPSCPVHTWAFWIWPMHKDNNVNLLYPQASLLRLARTSFGGDPNWFWEIGLTNCKVQFTQKDGSCIETALLTFQTAQTLDQMGITPCQWHHVAVVYDRNARTNSKIYI